MLAMPQQKPNISNDGQATYPFNFKEKSLDSFHFREEPILNYCAQQSIAKIGAGRWKNEHWSAYDHLFQQKFFN